jgi:hypothetical protein
MGRESRYWEERNLVALLGGRYKNMDYLYDSYLQDIVLRTPENATGVK